MTIPEEIKQKIERTACMTIFPVQFEKGAEYGYSLAQSEIESKEKDHNKVVKALSEKITEQSQEITRLKGLIEKMVRDSKTHAKASVFEDQKKDAEQAWQQFKTENKLE